MVILADSGRTKISWKFIAGGFVHSLETVGFNAVFSDDKQLLSLLETQVKPNTSSVKEIHFFGAGVIPGTPAEKLRRVLSTVWPGASIMLDSDIVIAAKALHGHKRGIACILGTGSNSCLWNGFGIEATFNGGGYLLGDEGSGNWIGRTLLSDFVKDLLPAELKEDFISEYGLDYPTLVKEVYSRDSAAGYLSSFAMFATRWKEHPYISSMVKSGFDLFLSRNVLRYRQCTELEVGFVGSVASVFRTQLLESCHQAGLKVGKIIRYPVDELVSLYI